jgi:hypothetical protein
MIALGDNDPDWDIRSDIWSLACTVSPLLVCLHQLTIGILAHLFVALPYLMLKSRVPRHLSRKSNRRVAGPQAGYFTGLYD